MPIFNELYDSQHIPAILTVPGVHSCRRYVLEWGDNGALEYISLYEVDNPGVTQTDAWKEASNRGDWKTKVRPFLRERRNGMYRAI